MNWQWPWVFLLLVPTVAWARHRRQPAYGFGTLTAAAAAGQSPRQRWMWLPPALHTVGLAALIFALARPQAKISVVHEENPGIAIQLLVLQRYFFLQPVIASLGAAEFMLAWAWQRVSTARLPG